MDNSQWDSLCALIEEKLASESHAGFTVAFLTDKLTINGNLKQELRQFMTAMSCPYLCKFAYGDHEVSFRRKISPAIARCVVYTESEKSKHLETGWRIDDNAPQRDDGAIPMIKGYPY